MVPTPTFSKVENALESSTDIDPVESATSSILNLVGLTSDCALEIITKLLLKYIPWFLWSILICLPSVSVVIVPVASIPIPPFKFVVIPKLFTNWIVFPAPVIKSPWTLSTIIWLILAIPDNDNRIFFPTVNAPLEISRTSPIWYPLPPELIVAPTATPLFMVILAVASLPDPVIVSKLSPVKVWPPDDGVYPIPALMIFNVPVAVPALPT